jgi:hypothetical protein
VVEGVVDVLEAVEVDHQHRHGAPGAPCMRDGLGRTVAQVGAVGQPVSRS